MEALEAILSRKVQRTFAKKPVALDTLLRIVEAGRHAMSARNLQPWQFIIVRDRDTIRAMGALCSTGRFVADAPAAIVVLKDLANARWADIDCAQAVQNMANAGWALGLGTCWVGNLDREGLSKMLAVPDGWTIFTVLPFGPLDLANSPATRSLKKRSEMVHYERFGQTEL